jgi:hypothetical protein
MPLSEWLSKDALGYQVHTKHELGLMLRGLKPLAVFTEDYDCFHEIVRRYLSRFDRRVEAGIFEKREYVEIREGRRVHVIMYCLPGQAWRIDAMIELYRRLSHWDAEAERIEGALLGYEPWQNDIWMAERFGKA